MARKRKSAGTTSNRALKKHKSANDGPSCGSGVHHNVLSSFYPKTCTLRDYLLASLPATSRVRRRNLTTFASDGANFLLDTCLVGVLKQPSWTLRESRKADFVAFTQSQHHATANDTGRAQSCSIDEIVDFVIWSLFKACTGKAGRPLHILCHGLQKGAIPWDGPGAASAFLPGIIRRQPNDSLAALKSAPWADILPLLGADSEVIFSTLLLDCGIFAKVESGKDNYFQFSGTPLSEVSQTQTPRPTHCTRSNPPKQQNVSIGKIRFVRHRVLYARPSLNAAGKVKSGLHHTHILQRVADAAQQRHAVHLLKYVFPRQFGLHNVFTSKVNRDETVQKLKDYTFREQEITGQKKKALDWAPRRLRREPIRLVQKIHRNHKACSYSQLLRHHCAILSDRPNVQRFSSERAAPPTLSSAPLKTQVSLSGTSRAASTAPSIESDGDTSFLAHATPVTSVSAFCRAALSKLLPRDAFGSGAAGQQNVAIIAKRIDEFVNARRFETFTLHQAVQGIQIKCITWLAKSDNAMQKISKTDFSKRLEVLHEFVYYIFDSLLIPVIRAHFYVTESSTYRHRLFYFRQDVWRKLSEPSLAMLRLTIYTPIRPSDARHKLLSRSLGYSHLRLLPKDQGARPITNLKRRQLKLSSGKRVLGASINAQLAPLFSVLNFERARNSRPLASALLSIGEIHGKVAGFKKAFPPGSRLYFAKVDIKSCFDSIPQEHLLSMVEYLLGEQSYRTTRHLELKSLDQGHKSGEGLRKKFTGAARPDDDQSVYSSTTVSAIAGKKSHVVFSDLGQQFVWNRKSLLKLLRDHVGDSMIKMGKRYMKQVDGIPQGSVLSSLLCSYFYGAFERTKLDFLHPQTCALLRYIDDFLLITTDESLARRFLSVMADGGQQYGIQVNPDKSLVNFDVTINSRKVPRLHAETAFPYCGISIDMETLELRKDREKKDPRLSNALTVESCSRPGSVLKRKTLASLKQQMHSMLLDMSLNSRGQVILTLVGNFTESAMKMHQYLAGLSAARRPSQELVRKMIEDLILAGWKMCRAKASSCGQVKQITRAQMCWIGAAAFERVLGRKQSQYRDLLVWLKVLREESQPKMNVEQAGLEQLLCDNDRAFRAYLY